MLFIKFSQNIFNAYEFTFMKWMLFLIVAISTCFPSQEVVIKIAILDSAIPSFTSPPEMMEILDGYKWHYNKTYRFEADWITDFEIIAGKLKKYDVVVIPGIGKEFWRINKNLSLWKKELRSFVANGGGYFGVCGGANIASLGLLPPSQRGWKHWTMWEWFMNEAAIGIVPVYSYQDMADPFASCIIWKNPFRVGFSAYVWYNLSINGTGICQYCKINNSHPIFKGYENNKRLMRWVAGPALIPVGNVSILAWFPDENISGKNGNKSTSIHAWRFSLHPKEPFDFWDMENGLIETHLAGKPAGVACKYGKGRVIIFGHHPEHPVWKGGEIYEVDNKFNHLFGLGLFRWRDRKFLPSSYNWWIVRRCVAWVAGINEKELPPIE